MTVSRGDVVLVDFPFSAGGGSKVRPAVVVQNDRDNRRLTNIIVAMITSQTPTSDD
jgi:mRNA interferase MazF